ncbi:MAG: hypothetical protein EBY32_16570 [Proteobacteria bacterium]|jgi:hypothetical protein|nr:hypothetical protein [Pseudomonadota bacterium]
MFVPFAVRMRSNGYVRDTAVSGWRPLAEQWVLRGETIADKKRRAENARADKVIGVLTRFISRWVSVRVYRRRHAIREWKRQRAYEAWTWRTSFEPVYVNADPVVLSWMITGSWADHEVKMASEKKARERAEVCAIVEMSAAEWKSLWQTRVQMCKTDVTPLFAWVHEMNALREKKRVADEIMRAPRKHYVGSVYIGSF